MSDAERLGQMLRPEFIRRREAGEDIRQATIGAMEALAAKLGPEAYARLFQAGERVRSEHQPDDTDSL